MHHRVSFVVFSGSEDLRVFSISSGVDKAHLVDVCIKLHGGISLIGQSRSGDCKINKIINCEPSRYKGKRKTAETRCMILTSSCILLDWNQ